MIVLQPPISIGANFYCGVCGEAFELRETRETHKLKIHAEHYEALASSLVKRAQRNAGMLPVGIVEAPRPLPTMSADKHIKSAVASAMNGPSDKQQAFITSLWAKRGITDGEMPQNGKAASKMIDELLKMPSKPKEPRKPDASVVPAGYYALDGNGKNETAFYKVDKPTDGQWAGFTFVKLVVGGQSDRNMPRDQKAGILARIEAAGIAEATARYGQEIGRCGICNRTLTDDESRAAGIGPVCREKGM